MFRWLLPREGTFFEYFEGSSKLSVEACRELAAIASAPAELAQRATAIKDIEHRADDIAHHCIDALHRTFITPMDRADIHRLIQRLDDIIDSVDAAASRMALYELSEIRPEMKQFTAVLLRATTEIDGAMHRLRNLKAGGEAISASCRAIFEIENEADQILRSALARLFREEKDAVLVIKWKEVFERLEKATDRCEEVANVVQDIVIGAS